MRNYTVEELWEMMWPGTPWSEASAQDKRLFLDHANSLAVFNDRA